MAAGCCAASRRVTSARAASRRAVAWRSASFCRASCRRASATAAAWRAASCRAAWASCRLVSSRSASCRAVSWAGVGSATQVAAPSKGMAAASPLSVGSGAGVGGLFGVSAVVPPASCGGSVPAGAALAGSAGSSTICTVGTSPRRACQGRSKPGSPSSWPPKLRLSSSAWNNSDSNSPTGRRARLGIALGVCHGASPVSSLGLLEGGAASVVTCGWGLWRREDCRMWWSNECSRSCRLHRNCTQIGRSRMRAAVARNAAAVRYEIRSMLRTFYLSGRRISCLNLECGPASGHPPQQVAHGPQQGADGEKRADGRHQQGGCGEAFQPVFLGHHWVDA